MRAIVIEAIKTSDRKDMCKTLPASGILVSGAYCTSLFLFQIKSNLFRDWHYEGTIYWISALILTMNGSESSIPKYLEDIAWVLLIYMIALKLLLNCLS